MELYGENWSVFGILPRYLQFSYQYFLAFQALESNREHKTRIFMSDTVTTSLQIERPGHTNIQQRTNRLDLITAHSHESHTMTDDYLNARPSPKDKMIMKAMTAITLPVRSFSKLVCSR